MHEQRRRTTFFDSITNHSLALRLSSSIRFSLRVHHHGFGIPGLDFGSGESPSGLGARYVSRACFNVSLTAYHRESRNASVVTLEADVVDYDSLPDRRCPVARTGVQSLGQDRSARCQGLSPTQELKALWTTKRGVMVSE